MVPPDGWSQEVRPDGVMMLSPANERGDRAIYLMLRPQAADGELKPWLMQQTGEAAGLFGRLKDRKAVKWIKVDSYYKHTFTAVTEEGETVKGYFLARETQFDGLIQTAIVAWPSTFEIGVQGAAYSAPETHFWEVGNKGYVVGIPTPGFGLPPDPPPVYSQPATNGVDANGFGQAQIPSAGADQAAQSQVQPRPAPAPPAPEATAAPGAIGEQGVEAVVLGSTTVGTQMLLVPFLFLKDGRSYLQVTESPLDFKPNSRPPGNYGDGRWQRTPAGYQATYPNATPDDFDATGRLGPAAANFRLSGTYRALGGSGGSSWGEQFTFRDDGTVQLAQGSSVNGSGYSATGRGSNTARYAIGGWTITIGGQRKLFARGNEPAPNLIVIGDGLYRRQ